MKHNKSITKTGLIAALMLLLYACSEITPDEAEQNLQDENIPVTEEALIANVQTNDAEVVRGLLTAGVTPDAQDEQDVPALIWASDLGYAGIAEQLIAHGARIDTRENGVSPLMIAAMEGHSDVVEILLEADANVDLQNQEGMTALMSAAFSGHKEIVKLLIENQADPLLKMSNGVRAHQLANYEGHEEIASYIREVVQR